MESVLEGGEQRLGTVVSSNHAHRDRNLLHHAGPPGTANQGCGQLELRRKLGVAAEASNLPHTQKSRQEDLNELEASLDL